MKKIKFIKQRVKQGYADTDVYNIDYWFLETIVPMLKQLKEQRVGYPMDLSPEKWDKILDEMIFCFTECNENTCSIKNQCAEEYLNKPLNEIKDVKNTKQKWLEKERKICEYRENCKNRGLNLFKKYFWNLWD